MNVIIVFSTIKEEYNWESVGRQTKIMYRTPDDSEQIYQHTKAPSALRQSFFVYYIFLFWPKNLVVGGYWLCHEFGNFEIQPLTPCICAMQFDLTPLFVWSLHPWSLHVPRCCDPCLSLARQPPYTVIGTWWYATINSSLMSGRVTPINSFTAKSFASSSGKPSFDRKWSKSNQSSESFKERRKGCWSC